MLKNVVGIRPYKFTDQKTKEEVEGCNVFLQWKEEEVQGTACESLSVSKKKLEGYEPKVGDKVRVGYNKYGKCDFIVKE